MKHFTALPSELRLLNDGSRTHDPYNHNVVPCAFVIHYLFSLITKMTICVKHSSPHSVKNVVCRTYVVTVHVVPQVFTVIKRD